MVELIVTDWCIIASYIDISNWFELTTHFLTFIAIPASFPIFDFFIHFVCLLFIECHKCGKIRCGKLSWHLRFSTMRVFCESLTIVK